MFFASFLNNLFFLFFLPLFFLHLFLFLFLSSGLSSPLNFLKKLRFFISLFLFPFSVCFLRFFFFEHRSFLVPFFLPSGYKLFLISSSFFELFWSLFASPFFSFLNQKKKPSFLKRLIIFSMLKKKLLIFENVFGIQLCFTFLSYSILVSLIFLLLVRLKEYLFFWTFFRVIFLFFRFLGCFSFLLLFILDVLFLFLWIFHFDHFVISLQKTPVLCLSLSVFSIFLSSFFHHFLLSSFQIFFLLFFHSPFIFSQRENIFLFPFSLLSFPIYSPFFFLFFSLSLFFPVSCFFRLFFPFLCLFFFLSLVSPFSFLYFFLVFFFFSFLSLCLFFYPISNFFGSHFSFSDNFFISFFLDFFCSWSHFSRLPSSQLVSFIFISSKNYLFVHLSKIASVIFSLLLHFLCGPFFDSNLLFFISCFLIFFLHRRFCVFSYCLHSFFSLLFLISFLFSCFLYQFFFISVSDFFAKNIHFSRFYVCLFGTLPLSVVNLLFFLPCVVLLPCAFHVFFWFVAFFWNLLFLIFFYQSSFWVS